MSVRHLIYTVGFSLPVRKTYIPIYYYQALVGISILFMTVCPYQIELGHNIPYKIASASSNDQPAHPRMLIRVFVGHSLDTKDTKRFRRTANSVIRLRD